MSTCEALGASLAVPNNQVENEYLTALSSKLGNVIWAGVSIDNATSEWIDINTGVQVFYEGGFDLPWKQGQPDSDPHVVVMQGSWRAQKSLNTNYFTCEYGLPYAPLDAIDLDN